MDALRQNVIVDASQPVLRAGISADEFCRLLNRHIERSPLATGTRSQRLRHNDSLRGVERLRQFLGEGSVAVGDLNERTLAEYRKALQASGLETAYANDLVRHTRNAINCLPKSILNRQLLDDKAHQRATRLDGLERNTVELLTDYLSHGRKVRKGVLTAHPLSATYKENVVGATLRLLKAIRQADLKSATAADGESCLRQYEQKGMHNSGVETLVSVSSLFRYGMAKGVLTANPFAPYTGKIVTADDDFVVGAGIDLLRDLSNLETKSFMDVRNRMIAFALCYDYALRIGEAVRLDTTDFAMDDDLVTLTLRPEVQKGMNKRRAVLHNFFPESKTLIRQYLALRQALGAADGAFLVADDGRRLGVQGARDAVEGVCRRLGANTYERGEPTPHRLRHSFGTLNIEPLGLSLSPYEISERLRHENLKTTLDTYVTRNPLLQRARHLARLQKASGTQGVGVDMPAAARGDFTMTEAEAVGAVRALGIGRHTLRAYCSKRGTAKLVNWAWTYARSAVADLAANWMTKSRAIRLLRLSNSGFYFWVKANDIHTMTIGKTCLVRNDAVLPALERKSA